MSFELKFMGFLLIKTAETFGNKINLLSASLETWWVNAPFHSAWCDLTKTSNKRCRAGRGLDYVWRKAWLTWRDMILYYHPWNKQLAPENGWLEDDRFLLGMASLQVRFVSFREGIFIWIWKILGNALGQKSFAKCSKETQLELHPAVCPYLSDPMGVVDLDTNLQLKINC